MRYTRTHSIWCSLYKDQEQAKLKHDFGSQGNVTLKEEDNDWRAHKRDFWGVNYVLLLLLVSIYVDVFTVIIHQAVYLLCVYFSICMFCFNIKVSLTKLSKFQSKTLSVNTISDRRKINYLNTRWKAKQSFKNVLKNQALIGIIIFVFLAVKWVLNLFLKMLLQE